jgi:hypothetical protein
LHVESLVAAKWWADRLPLPDDQIESDQIESFRTFLIDLIEKHLKGTRFRVKGTRFRGRVRFRVRVLKTDYVPYGLLKLAADRAGITEQMLRFPVKTAMHIYPGRVYVTVGYRAVPQVIYKDYGIQE